MRDYTLITQPYLHLLAPAVNAALQTGAIPLGAPFIDTDCGQWCQAVAWPTDAGSKPATKPVRPALRG